MANISIQRVAGQAAEATCGVLADIEQLFDRVRERAYQIFSSDGQQDGHALEHWFQAERELLGAPPAELAENDTSFEIRVALPGMSEDQISVTALNNQILVKGTRGPGADSSKYKVLFSEFPSTELLRRFDLSSAVNVDNVTAKLEKGVLTISAPKVSAAEKEIPVSAAA